MNLTKDSYTIKSLLKSMKKTWLLSLGIFVGLSLLLGGGIYYYSHHKGTNTNYTAMTKIILSPEDKDLDAGGIEMYIKSEKEVLQSKKIKKIILKQSRKDDMKSIAPVKYKISLNDGTSVLDIKATASTAKKAVRTSNYVAKTFVENKDNILQQGSARLVDKSSKAESQKATSFKKYYLVAVLLSFAISIAIVGIKAYYDPKIYDIDILLDNSNDITVYNANSNGLKNVIQKVMKSASLNNSNLSIMYFEESAKAKLMNGIAKVTDSKNYALYSDEKSNYEQIATDELYKLTDKKTKLINVIDSMKIINVLDNPIQVLFVQEGKTTKEQISSAYREVKSFSDAKIYVIYSKA